MVTISAFADEIDPSLDVQMEVCRSHGIRHIDVRGIDGLNVSKFTVRQVREYARQLHDAGFAVPCVGSPLGKIRIDEDLAAHLDLTKHCCRLAAIFHAPYVRVFSFYGPPGGDIADHRTAVMDMLARMAAVAADANVVLLHENEKAIYGSTPDQVKDIFQSVQSPCLKGIFDPANFIEEHIAPYEGAWLDGLAERTEYFHIKDKVRAEDPTCVPAGEGSGKLDRILADAKARGLFDRSGRNGGGYLTLEPHMKEAGAFAGFSGPERFARAVAGLKKVCDSVGLEYH